MKYIEKDFKECIKENLVLVDFWAPWCGPCQMFGPILESVEKEYDNISFYKYNVDDDKSDVCKEYGIMSIPTIILFKNGKEYKKNIGFLNENELKEFLGDKNV